MNALVAFIMDCLQRGMEYIEVSSWRIGYDVGFLHVTVVSLQLFFRFGRYVHWLDKNKHTKLRKKIKEWTALKGSYPHQHTIWAGGFRCHRVLLTEYVVVEHLSFSADFIVIYYDQLDRACNDNTVKKEGNSEKERAHLINLDNCGHTFEIVINMLNHNYLSHATDD